MRDGKQNLMWGALVAAIIGGLLLYYSGLRGADQALAFAALVVGLILFIATTWVLASAYKPGDYTPSPDDLPHREWRWYQFLRHGYNAAVLLLPIRIYLGYLWLSAGWDKVNSPAWTGSQAGAALRGFVQGALAKTSGEHPDVQGWYAWFLRELVLPNATLFSYLVAWGEVLVGIALILGVLTGVAAFFGGFMNANFLLAGAVSTNPIMLALELVLIIGWRPAGWWGLDRWIIPRIRPLWGEGQTKSVRAREVT